MIAVSIKTCPGRFSLTTTLNSIHWALRDQPYRIYLADEAPLDDWKKALYEKLERDGHFVYIWPEKVSVNKARNHLLDTLQDEKYILRLDDDFELGGEFSIEAMVACIEDADDIALCASLERQIGLGKFVSSGMLRLQATSEITENTLHYHYRMNDNWDYHNAGEYRYALADHVRNLFLMRREVAEKVRWDERLQFEGEHDDFQLSIKDAGYKLAFTPNSIHLHRDDLKSMAVTDTNQERQLRHKDIQHIKDTIFQEKWSFNKIGGTYPLRFYITRKLYNLTNRI